ncbi:MAG: hypothetical protein ACREVY_02180 [Gammaproteobacteria bacterium]
MSNYSPELKRILRENGCRFERHGKGGHELWFSPISNFAVDYKIKSRHTANAAGCNRCCCASFATMTSSTRKMA